MTRGDQAGPYRTTAAELAAEVAVMAAALLCMALFARHRFMPAAMAVIIGGRFLLLNRRGDWVFFLIGVIVGGGNDLLSMYKGVYSYAAPTVLPAPIPLWMVVFWGQIFVSFRKLMRYGQFLGPDEPPARLLDLPLALDLVVAVVYRLIIYRTASIPWQPDALYAAILVTRLLLIPPREHERKLLLAMLVIGPVYEMILIGAGFYHYQTGVLFGMPLWLIVYWVFVSRMLKAIFDRVEHFLARGRT